MKRYKSKPPILQKFFSVVPEYDIQYCKKSDGKINTGELNMDGFPIYKDQNGIFYNKVYYSDREQPYIINSSYARSGNIILHGQILSTHSSFAYSYKSFLQSNTRIRLDDPYELNMFNGHCCLGNIDYEPLGMIEPYKDMAPGKVVFNIWTEIMKRCFDPTYFEWQFFGGQGALPAIINWKCFRYYYCMTDEAYHKCGFLPRPFELYNYLLLSQRLSIPNYRMMKAFPAPIRLKPLNWDEDFFINRGYDPDPNQKKRLYRIVEDQL